MEFYKHGVEIFNGMQSQYGGHWQKLSHWTQLDYLAITIWSPDTLYEVFILKDFSKIFNLQTTYYDGHHHHINLVLFIIAWGGPPYTEYR